MANNKTITKEVAKYYDKKLADFGTNPKGVDWNSKESQFIRFDQITKACDTSEPFSILDYGCGYGALVDYLIMHKYKFRYYGYDISTNMIDKAKTLYKDLENCDFFSAISKTHRADYCVASGIFNVKMNTKVSEWEKYIFNTLDDINARSKRGFSFNILTSYSNREYMRDYLYYADPKHFFDHCKRNYSPFISLLHDYPLFEFTILVNKTENYL